MSRSISKYGQQRFQEFQEFTDRTGFLIKEQGREIEFYYDQERGWFDEHGNYYNKNGVVSTPSHKSLDFWDTIKKHYEEKSFDDYYDDLLNEYEQDFNEFSDEEDEHDFLHQAELQEQINRLLCTLKAYDDRCQIKVYFSGIRPKCSEAQVKSFFGKDTVQTVVFEQKGKFRTGKGHLVVKNKDAVRNIIWKHRQELEGQEVYLDMETLGDTLSDDEDTNHSLQSTKEDSQTLPQQYQYPIPDKQVDKKPIPIIKVVLPKQPPPQQKPQQKSLHVKQHDGYDILFQNIPQTETICTFEEWLLKEFNKTWRELRAKRDQNNSTQQIKVNFINQRGAEEILSFFAQNKGKLMFKGRNRLTVTKIV